MATQMQKSAVRSLDKAEFVVQSTRTTKSSVTANLDNVFSPLRQGEDEGTPTPDWDVAQEANAALLDHASSEVRSKDEVFRTAKVRVSEVGRKRRSQVSRIQGIYRDLRKSAEGAYGPDALALLGLDALPALGIPAVREQAVKLAGRMRSPDLIARLVLRPGQTHLDIAKLADGLETQVGILNDLVEEYKRQRKVADQAFVAKEEALAFHRRVYVNVTRIQEAYYRLAGLDELARRLRSAEPSPRSSSPDDTREPNPPSSPAEEAPVTA